MNLAANLKNEDWMTHEPNVRRRGDGWAVLMGRDYRWYAIQNDGERMTDDRGSTRMFGDDKAAMEFVDRFHPAKNRS